MARGALSVTTWLAAATQWAWRRSCVVSWASLSKFTVRAVSHFDWHGRGRGAGRVSSAGATFVSTPSGLSVILIGMEGGVARVVSSALPAFVSTPSGLSVILIGMEGGVARVVCRQLGQPLYVHRQGCQSF